MNKKELVDSISQSADITKTAAEKVLDCFIQSIENTLKNDSKLVLIGFGTFSASKHKTRTGRNPQTESN